MAGGGGGVQCRHADLHALVSALLAGVLVVVGGLLAGGLLARPAVNGRAVRVQLARTLLSAASEGVRR